MTDSDQTTFKSADATSTPVALSVHGPNGNIDYLWVGGKWERVAGYEIEVVFSD